MHARTTARLPTSCLIPIRSDHCALRRSKERRSSDALHRPLPRTIHSAASLASALACLDAPGRRAFADHSRRRACDQPARAPEPWRMRAAPRRRLQQGCACHGVEVRCNMQGTRCNEQKRNATVDDARCNATADDASHNATAWGDGRRQCAGWPLRVRCAWDYPVGVLGSE